MIIRTGMLLLYRQWWFSLFGHKAERDLGKMFRRVAKPTHFQVVAVWYVIQTETGKEQGLVDVINRMADRKTYERCFIIKREAVWRLQGRCVPHVERLFPGYVFVVTEKPEEFYGQLKQIPCPARILGKEEDEFHPVPEEEKEFLEILLNGDSEDVVRLSPVIVDEDGGIIKAGGALKHYMGLIIKKRIRLRYVVIRIALFGRSREIYMGICLAGDAGGNINEFLGMF